MPTRKIPKSYRNVTGRLASSKNQGAVGFESTLEKDFYILLEFDESVTRYEEQPVTIDYIHDGQQRTYTPDVLVYQTEKPVTLYEVKLRDDLREHWKDYKPKFKAAIRYCKQRGWRFKLITENEIRIPRLNAVRFLLRYREHPVNTDDIKQLTAQLSDQPIPAEALLSACSDNRYRQAELIPVLWYLVANNKISADLGTPLNMQSAIWRIDE